LALLAANQEEVEPASAGRAVLLSLVLGALACLLAWLVVRRREAAVTLASLGTIAFFSYGHVYDGLKTLGPAGISLARHRYLWIFEVAVLLGLALLLRRRTKPESGVALWLTTFAWILVIFPIASIVAGRITEMGTPAPPAEAAQVELKAEGDNLPDIYYVILDGYGRQDVLRALYAYDNESFLDFLRSRGFYVADQAMSNYNYTYFSLASSLNMAYLGPGTVEDSSYRRSVRASLKANQVFALARNLGYEVVAFDTGYRPTTMSDADIFLRPDYGSPSKEERIYTSLTLNEFVGLLLDTTWGKVVLAYYASEIQRQAPGLIDSNYEKHRARVEYTLSSLSEIGQRPGAHLVMAHVVAPHPPFVFGPQGQRLVQTGPYSLTEIGCCDQDEYVSRYRDQVEYVNQLLRLEIDELLQASETPPIIILQGDHGPGGHLGPQVASTQGMQARMGILNAYYFPDGDMSVLDPWTSPVNSFRLIFDQFFGGDFGRLEDVSYFLNLDAPYETVLVRPFSMDDE
jgi:hypothetical protein